MKVFTKLLSVVLAVMVFSALVIGQSSELDKFKLSQMDKELSADVAFGVKPAPNQTVGSSDVSYATSNASKDVLLDNGPFITHPTGGSGGNGASALQTALTMGTFGSNVNHNALPGEYYYMADDFTATGTWTLTSIKFFGYQTGSTTTSTFNGVYVQIWNGDPSLATSSVVWGDLTTNRFLSTAWTNVYRVLDTDMMNTQRPIMQIVANMAGCVLPAGNYWVQWGLTGTGASGPWGPPITILGQTTTGNAKQKTTAGQTGWVDLIDVGPQGQPFVIEGTSGAAATNDLGVIAITAPNTGVNLTSAEPVTITIQNFGTAAQSNFPVSYTIDGGAPVTATVTSTIAGGATLSYTFTTPADLSAYGTYNFQACANLAGDENAANNCASKTVVNSAPSLCVPIYTTGCSFGDGLEDFILEQISNVASGCGNLNGTGWSQYFGLGPAMLTAGQTYNVTMNPGYANTFVTIWIDFNDDLDLTMDEIVLNSYELLTAGVSQTTQITIPANAGNGQHVMRARTNWLSGTTDPCGSLTYGEAEDYYVVVGGGVMLDPPTDLTAVVVDETDVLLNWTAPGGGPGPGEWIQWDDGLNQGNGIGLTAGGTFWVASHWTPADLAAYNGQTLTKISFFPYGDAAATFELEVRTGPTAGTIVMSQLLASYTVDTWNEVTLTSPVTIDATTDLWFGYKVTHGASTFPAGTDNGPAVANKGDMISLDGTAFLSMSVNYGLNYNWNLAGYVVGTDAIYPPQQMVKSTAVAAPADASFASAIASGQGSNFSVKFNPGSSKALLGYNVYRNSNMIDYTTATTYLDEDLTSGTYNYYVTAVYDEGESGPSNTETVTISISNIIYCDDFESYTVGQQLVAQNSVNWTTWSNAPGGNEDPFIVNNGGNVVEITGLGALADDLVYVIPDFTEGFYSITFDIYIPTAKDGYFNVLQDFAGAGSQWGMQVYFDAGGAGSIDGGGAAAATFIFTYDTWHAVEVIVDLDNDWGEFYLNGNLIHGWVWSGGTFGTGTLNQLGGVNFYAWTGANGAPLYHFDNFCFVEAEGPAPLDPPTNLTGTAVGDEAHLSWTAPSGGGGQLYELVQHDGNAANGYFQAFGSGYGVVYDLSGYTDATVEFVDFRHSSWGTFGTWSYKIHIVDWNTYTSLAVVGPLQTTGNDQWELLVPLGSIPESGLVGIFMEPMGNISTDAYPCIDSDDVGPDGLSYFGPLTSFSGMALSGIGDFLMDLWIMAEAVDGPVKAPKFVANFGNGVSRLPSVTPDMEEITLKQTAKGADAILQGYNVYRYGVNIGYVAAPTTTYIDPDLSPGTYEYYVKAVYDEGESPASNTATVIIEGAALPAPTNLTGPASVTTGNPINLAWQAPADGEWLQWDAGVNNGNAIGLTNGGTFSVASRWMPADLTNYSGFYLQKINFFPNDAAATYTIKVWTGPNGSTQVYSQAVTSFMVEQWNEVILTTPVQINAATDFWFGYETTHGAGTFPAGTDDGPAIQNKGDMILTGGSWASLYVLTGGSLNYNWNLAGWVSIFESDATTSEPVLIEMTPASAPVSLSESGSTGISVKMPENSIKALDGYNVYRNGVKINTAIVVPTNYTDVVNMSGLYTYYVTAVYSNPAGESGPSNEHVVDVETSINETGLSLTQIFPNPAKEMVNITSDFTIHSVTVYNFTGQIVANENVDGYSHQLNTSGLKAGIYIFHINTSNGTVMERIVVQ
jgi:hypothetical protein